MRWLTFDLDQDQQGYIKSPINYSNPLHVGVSLFFPFTRWWLVIKLGFYSQCVCLPASALKSSSLSKQLLICWWAWELLTRSWDLTGWRHPRTAWWWCPGRASWVDSPFPSHLQSKRRPTFRNWHMSCATTKEPGRWTGKVYTWWTFT